MRIIIVVVVLVVGIGFGYFIFNQGKIRINNERAGIMLLRGGYRAWWIRYSNGLQCLPGNKYKNLWCRPSFEHCDVRKLRPLKEK